MTSEAQPTLIDGAETSLINEAETFLIIEAETILTFKAETTLTFRIEAILTMFKPPNQPPEAAEHVLDKRRALYGPPPHQYQYSTSHYNFLTTLYNNVRQNLCYYGLLHRLRH